MGDYYSEIREALAKMNAEERRAYSLALAHTYNAVFEVIYKAHTTPLAIRERIQEQWEQVLTTLKTEGML